MSTHPATSPTAVPIADALFVFDLTEQRLNTSNLERLLILGPPRPVNVWNIDDDSFYIECKSLAGDETRTCFPISLLEYLGEAVKLGGAGLMKTGILTPERTVAALEVYISKAIRAERVRAFARVGGLMAPHQPIAASVWNDVRITKWHKGEAETVAGERLFDLRVLPAEVECVQTEAMPVLSRPKQAARRGRPPEHNWEGARAFADKYVEQHGLPKVQERFIEAIKDWFVKNDPPKAPDTKFIRVNILKRFYE